MVNLSKRNAGLLAASAEKRYKSFVVTACDTEKVWIWRGAGAGHGAMFVWPYGEIARMFHDADEISCLDVHDFMDELGNMDKEAIVHVFPNGTDEYAAKAGNLLNFLLEELELVE